MSCRRVGVLVLSGKIEFSELNIGWCWKKIVLWSKIAVLWLELAISESLSKFDFTQVFRTYLDHTGYIWGRTKSIYAEYSLRTLR